MDISEFYKEKIVLITGHSGFKGSWLTRILSLFGSEVYGYSLAPNTNPNLFSICKISSFCTSRIDDIRNFEHLNLFLNKIKPEIVFHLAAQPLVRESYLHPLETYSTNVMGTVNICECVKKSDSVKSFLNITTDKVYFNNEWEWGYREIEPLDGYDPYSNSKSCSELVTHSYNRCFFKNKKIGVSTARAGNVIGGGDFSVDRIIPDCVRAVINHRNILVRNPNSVRPYQHVLEPLFAYLLIGMKQYTNPDLAGYYNVGPSESDCLTTGELASLFCEKWGDGAKWESYNENGPHEANFLRLDCSKIRSLLGWKPIWSARTAVEKTVEWTKAWNRSSSEALNVMDNQINDYLLSFNKEYF
ncbi:MAG: CDP-glucose 4,6-dehydratase [Aeromonadales bacterium]|nr:CDP-glucose 4,6-dehydratase [Aeromonadales bacterium]MDY2891833.1 CDP-glucose 4,6-dehydratase [Succinivibrio sp.]